VNYFEAPYYDYQAIPGAKIFFAGGITNCIDWQTALRKYLEADPKLQLSDLTILNPRRKNFPIHDPKAAEQQIEWEFHALRAAHIISFWFASGSLNPIVLFEYGVHLTRALEHASPLVVVGCDPDYQRTSDVVIQTQLADPRKTVHRSFKPFCEAVLDCCQRIAGPK
jgi:hypothetical protein